MDPEKKTTATTVAAATAAAPDALLALRAAPGRRGESAYEGPDGLSQISKGASFSSSPLLRASPDDTQSMKSDEPIPPPTTFSGCGSDDDDGGGGHPKGPGEQDPPVNFSSSVITSSSSSPTATTTNSNSSNSNSSNSNSSNSNSNTSSSSSDKGEAQPPTTRTISNPNKYDSFPTRRRGSGWGIPPGLGLRGGADTMSNGTTGWGPPPSAGGAAAGGGWGTAPPPSASASAAWGAPNPSDDSASGASAASNGAAVSGGNGNGGTGAVIKPQAPSQPGQQQQGQPHQQSQNSASAPSSGPQSSTPAPAGSSTQAPSGQPLQGASSWAAAAGKGLPPSSDSGGNSSDSSSSANKQLEHLNSVREALFSPDGWGGGNVKQDTAWDVDPRPNGSDAAAAAAAMGAGQQVGIGGPKDPNMWGGGPPRNDGTDLWKSTLSGQPPAPKPQHSSTWSHTPQNPTDYKQWGEEDDGAGGDPGNSWRPDHPPGPYNKSHDSWKNDPRSMSNAWNSDMPGGMAGGRDMMPPPHDAAGSGWGAPPMPRQANPNQWGGPPGRWEHDSPNLGRRPHGHGGMDDPSGTSLWGNKAPSKWQDMPTNSMARGPPGGPPGPRGMIGGHKEPWGHGPGAHRGGWGDDGMGKGGWGDEPMKRDPGTWGAPGGPGGDSQWNKPPRGMMPMRSSPSWDDPGALDGPPGGGGWSNRQAEMAKQKELIMNSKSFKILCDMGYRKEDVEYALRVCNMRMEDAMEMLNQNGGRRMPPQHDMPFGDNPMDPRGTPHFPGYPHGDPGNSQLGMPGGGPAGLPMNSPMGPRMGAGGVGGNAPGLPATNAIPPQHRQQQPQHQQQPSQPSAQQLRLLVQQIQMAVQAGHLNPQILNQPLAPQTLLLLNQLLNQIKTLQQLQQQHQLAARNNPNNPTLMGVTVNITKTKQHIQNLQNQISAQQANYLKSQVPAQNPPPAGMGAQQVPGGGVPPQEGGSTSTVQEMFNGLNLMGQEASPGNGSRLNQWKKGGEFIKNPGTGAGSSGGGKQGQQPSGNLLLDSNSPWGKSSDANGGGWPETSKAGGAADSVDNFGIPEFEPGKPWKGPGLKNPDEDPNLTPGSVAAGLSIGPHLSKAVSSSNLTTSSAGGSEGSTLGLTSPTWSLGGQKSEAGGGGGAGGGGAQKTPEGGAGSNSGNWPGKPPAVTSSSLTSQIGQDLWGAKTPASTATVTSSAASRPAPPGLSQPASSASSGIPPTSSAWPPSSSNGWSTNTGTGSADSGGPGAASGGGGSAWLILKNLTPQIDGSTLKTLCMQHGPLQHFDLYLNHSIALVMYASGREAAKAQKALNNCLLGNTTIHANMTSESEVSAILQQLGVSSAGAGGSGPGGAGGNQPGGPSTPTRGSTPSNPLLNKPSSGEGGWGEGAPVVTSAAGPGGATGGGGGGGGSGGSGGPLFSGGSVWGAPDSGNALHPFLPGDLLGEGNM